MPGRELQFAPNDPESFMCMAEFGSYFAYFDRDPDYETYAAQVRKWLRDSVDAKSLNAAFVDTTTIYIAQGLLTGKAQFLTPMTLLDLANVVGAIILYDNLFHLESDFSVYDFDPDELNQDLGNQQIFVPIPVVSVGAEEKAAVGSLLRSHWLHNAEYIQRLSNPRSPLAADAKQIRRAWNKLLGHRLNWRKWSRDNEEYVSRTYGDASDPPAFVREMLDLFTPGALALYGPPTVHPQRVSDFINECNNRSLFNWSVAYTLDLQYVPNSFRLPFQQFLWKRGLALRQTLRRYLDETFRSNATGLFPARQVLQLPFFLSAILARAESLQDLKELLLEFRLKATGFRKKRVELEQALNHGNTKEARRISKAIGDEECGALRKVVVGAAIAGVTSWGAISMEQAHPAVARVLSATADIYAGQVIEAIAGKLRPRIRFLTRVADAANEMTNALDRVYSLWPSGRDRGEFVTTFNLVKELAY